MRKHSLIAITAFTALGASAMAGAAGSGTFSSTQVLSRGTARAHGIRSPIWRASAGAAVSALSPAVVRDGSVVLRGVARAGGAELIQLRGRRARSAARYAVHQAMHSKTAALAPPATPAPAAAAYTPAGGTWYALRMCESGGNYAEDSGNGFYGAYQFSLSTWYGLGFTGLPSQASPATQDLAAMELQALAGWGQWPACSAQLGL